MQLLLRLKGIAHAYLEEEEYHKSGGGGGGGCLSLQNLTL